MNNEGLKLFQTKEKDSLLKINEINKKTPIIPYPKNPTGINIATKRIIIATILVLGSNL